MTDIPRCSRCGMPALEGPLRVIDASITVEGDDTIFTGRLLCDRCKTKPEPVQVVCDFCGEPGPEWMYDSSPFNVLVTDGEVMDQLSFDDTRWLACTPCRTLIDDNDGTALINRILALYGPPPDEDDLDTFKYAMDAYFTFVFSTLVRPAKEVSNT